MFKQISSIESIFLNEKAFITDPSCRMQDNKGLLLENIELGKYECFCCFIGVHGGGMVVSHLVAIKEEYLEYINIIDNFRYDGKRLFHATHERAINVKSQHAGIFDFDYFTKAESENFELLYDRACKCSSSNEQGGVIDYAGAVSVSGYGDLLYDVIALHDVCTGKIIGIVIDYGIERISQVYDYLSSTCVNNLTIRRVTDSSHCQDLSE